MERSVLAVCGSAVVMRVLSMSLLAMTLLPMGVALSFLLNLNLLEVSRCHVSCHGLAHPSAQRQQGNEQGENPVAHRW